MRSLAMTPAMMMVYNDGLWITYKVPGGGCYIYKDMDNWLLTAPKKEYLRSKGIVPPSVAIKTKEVLDEDWSEAWEQDQ